MNKMVIGLLFLFFTNLYGAQQERTLLKTGADYVQKHMEDAIHHLNQNDTNKAIVSYKEATKYDVGPLVLAPVYSGLAEVYFYNKDFDKAVALLNIITKTCPIKYASALAEFYLGMAYLYGLGVKQIPTVAREHFEQSLKHAPVTRLQILLDFLMKQVVPPRRQTMVQNSGPDVDYEVEKKGVLWGLHIESPHTPDVEQAMRYFKRALTFTSFELWTEMDALVRMGEFCLKERECIDILTLFARTYYLRNNAKEMFLLIRSRAQMRVGALICQTVPRSLTWKAYLHEALENTHSDGLLRYYILDCLIKGDGKEGNSRYPEQEETRYLEELMQQHFFPLFRMDAFYRKALLQFLNSHQREALHNFIEILNMPISIFSKDTMLVHLRSRAYVAEILYMRTRSGSDVVLEPTDQSIEAPQSLSDNLQGIFRLFRAVENAAREAHDLYFFHHARLRLAALYRLAYRQEDASSYYYKSCAKQKISREIRIVGLAQRLGQKKHLKKR